MPAVWVALNSWSWNKMEKTINTIIIQVTKLAGKTADNIIILNEMKWNEMKCVYNNKNNGLAINVINNRLNISNDWKKITLTQSSLVESSCLVEWSDSSVTCVTNEDSLAKRSKWRWWVKGNCVAVLETLDSSQRVRYARVNAIWPGFMSLRDWAPQPNPCFGRYVV